MLQSRGIHSSCKRAGLDIAAATLGRGISPAGWPLFFSAVLCGENWDLLGLVGSLYITSLGRHAFAPFTPASKGRRNISGVLVHGRVKTQRMSVC